ncbi:MAG: helix-turn-helix domain-containing protein [Candidatus Sumerlaeia bacterium]
MRRIFSNKLFRESDFPIQTDWHELNRDVDFHAHAFTELVLVFSGQGKHTVGGAEYQIGGGDVFVINRSQEHGYCDCRDLRLVNVLFDQDQLPLPLNELRAIPGYHALFSLEPAMRRRHAFQSRLKLTPDRMAGLDGWIEDLREELEARRPGYRCMALGQLIRLISFLARYYGAESTPPQREVISMAETMAWLEEHFAEDLRVEKLARMAHMSERSFQRAFREASGCAPINYVNRLRMARASELLRRTSLNVGEIAWEVGVRDANYFTRQFRKYMGITPLQYRRQESTGK